MEHEKCSVEKFSWNIENFSGVMAERISSELFVLGGYPWRILVYPKGCKKNDNLSIYLEVAQINETCKRWNRDVKFKLFVLNQLNTNKTITKASDIQFKPSKKDWGFHSFMSLAELHDPNKGFIVNDVCIVGVCVCKSRYEKQLNQTEHMEVEVPMPNPDVDAELVYAGLGRIICILKTRKVKDMNEQAWKELQGLWNELKKYKFDLSWLEPHVQSALGMKSYVEKSLHVEKLKEDMVLLKEKLAAAEVNLDTERNLLKAKGLKEVALDSELGCGSWRP